MSTAAHPVGFDPLIAEAKERARRRRLLALGALVVVVAATAVAIWAEIPPGDSSGLSAAGRGGVFARAPRAPVYSVDTGGGVTSVLSSTGTNSELWSSTTDGRTWANVTPPSLSGANADFDQVQFVDRLHGWLSAYVYENQARTSSRWELRRTTDGGRTWQTMTRPQCRGCDFDSFTFFDAEHGSVFAQEGFATNLFSTSDGGATWRPVSGPSLPPEQAAFVDLRHGVVEGEEVGPGGYVEGQLFRTSDAGRTWTPVEFDGFEVNDLAGGVAAVDGTFIVYGDWTSPSSRSYESVVYTSSDGGVRWQKHVAPSRVDLAGQGSGAGAPPPSNIFSAASPRTWVTADWSKRHLFETTDAGKTWQVLTMPRSFRDAQSIDFTSANSGWAVLRSSELMRTTDGGRHWTLASRPERKAHKRG